MADDSKLRTQAERGDRARAILENDLVLEAFESVQKQIETAWQTSAGPDKEQRENAYLMHRLLQNFRSHFETVVQTGEAGKRELLSLHEPKRGIFRHGRG